MVPPFSWQGMRIRVAKRTPVRSLTPPWVNTTGKPMARIRTGWRPLRSVAAETSFLYVAEA